MDGAWERVKRIFQDALDVSSEARPAFLDEAGGGDVALRREVESMLAAHAEAGAFLEQPAIPTDGGAVSWIGRRIGPYRIVGELGRGGMGTVFRAVRDGDAFRKEVALKLVRSGFESRLVVRRFRRERQILARLQHPNIAALYDGGATEDGQPYLVMEAVEGQPIEAWCEARGLATRGRLELLRVVCAAVQYAHRNLVVHRDIKPGNTLMQARGTPEDSADGLKLVEQSRKGCPRSRLGRVGCSIAARQP